MIKKLLCLFICISVLFTLMSCDKDTGKSTGEYYPVGVLTSYDISDYDTAYEILSHLKNRNALDYNSIIFDYEGEEFDFQYSILAFHGKKNPTDAFDFISSESATGYIRGYVILNNRECCCEDWIKENGGCVIQNTNTQKHVDKCILTYTEKIGIYEPFPEITDRSLLSIIDLEPNETPGIVHHDVEYAVEYDGVEILRFETCVPVDEDIRSLFINHLVVFRTFTRQNPY